MEPEPLNPWSGMDYAKLKAAEVFNINPGQVSPQQRRFAKMLLWAYGYSAGPETFKKVPYEAHVISNPRRPGKFTLSGLGVPEDRRYTIISDEWGFTVPEGKAPTKPPYSKNLWTRTFERAGWGTDRGLRSRSEGFLPIPIWSNDQGWRALGKVLSV